MDTSHDLVWNRIGGVQSGSTVQANFGKRGVLVGHYFLLLGNNRAGVPLGYVLDLSKNCWRSMPENRHRLTLHLHTATLVNDQIILLGVKKPTLVSDYATTPEAFTIDLMSMQAEWLPTYGNQPAFSFQNAANFYEPRKQLVLFGGTTGRVGERNNALELLHMESMVWQRADAKGEMPRKVIRHCACIANHTLVVIGGMSTALSVPAIYLIRLDEQHYVWQKIRPVGYRSNLEERISCFSLGNGRVLVYGGYKFELFMLDGLFSREPRWSDFNSAMTSKTGNADLEEYRIHGILPRKHEDPVAVRLGDKILLLGDTGSEYYELSARSSLQ